jgi:hypothetical protein
VLKTGDIVYLTRHYAEWIKMLKGDLDISLIHRIARVVKVINWRTKEGKLLLEQREKTGKWKNLNSKDFKYVLKVYYPDLKSKKTDHTGITAYEVLPLNFPETEYPLFEKYPQHLLDDMNKEDIEDIFKLERKDI